MSSAWGLLIPECEGDSEQPASPNSRQPTRGGMISSSAITERDFPNRARKQLDF